MLIACKQSKTTVFVTMVILCCTGCHCFLLVFYCNSNQISRYHQITKNNNHFGLVRVYHFVNGAYWKYVFNWTTKNNTNMMLCFRLQLMTDITTTPEQIIPHQCCSFSPLGGSTWICIDSALLCYLCPPISFHISLWLPHLGSPKLDLDPLLVAYALILATS